MIPGILINGMASPLEKPAYQRMRKPNENKIVGDVLAVYKRYNCFVSIILHEPADFR